MITRILTAAKQQGWFVTILVTLVLFAAAALAWGWLIMIWLGALATQGVGVIPWGFSACALLGAGVTVAVAALKS